MLVLFQPKFKRFFSKKKKKKKVFTESDTDFSAKIGKSNAFSGRITTCTSQPRHPISFGGGGAVFIFSPKIGLKSTKNVRFCILHWPTGGGGGGARAHPAPLLATLLYQSLLSNFHSLTFLIISFFIEYIQNILLLESCIEQPV